MYKTLETNHERLKKSKIEMSRQHKKEIVSVKQEHNELLCTARGIKPSTKSHRKRAKELTNQNLIDSITDLRKAIKNMTTNKSKDNLIIVKKLRLINKMRQELQAKTKKLQNSKLLLLAKSTRHKNT